MTHILYQQKAEPPAIFAPEAPTAPTAATTLPAWFWNQREVSGRSSARHQAGGPMPLDPPVLANLPGGWLAPPAPPVRRRPATPGRHAEPLEPTLRGEFPSWRPGLPPLPAPRPRRPETTPGRVLHPATFATDLLASWSPQSLPVRRRPRPAAWGFAFPPQLAFADVRYFRQPDQPTRREPAGQSPQFAYPLPPPLDPGPAQWSTTPARPPLARRAQQPPPCEAPAVWFWPVRLDGFFRLAAVPTYRRRTAPPQGTASGADLLAREPTPERWLASFPPPRRARRAADLPATPPGGWQEAFEVPLPGRLASLPPLPSRRTRQTPGHFTVAPEALGWVVTPPQWLAPPPLPPARPRQAQRLPVPLAWGLYPSWDVPVAHWWQMPALPPRRSARSAGLHLAAQHLAAQQHLFEPWARFVHGVRLVWRGHDAGRRWWGHDA